MVNKTTKNYAYFIFRLLVGFGFFLHGGQKLFGWFGGQGFSNLSGTFMFAGIVEFFAGILIFFGLFTSFAAILGAINMAGAFILVHLPNGINPLANRGELAMIYFAAMLVLAAFGSGKFSLEKSIFKKEFLHKK